MIKDCTPGPECFAVLLRHCLESGEAVHIDDLGIFMPGPNNGFHFVPNQLQRVFIAYVQEDAAAAKRLYGDLSARGFNPWLDKKRLLPGQNWPRAIEQAIETSDFFIPCFSRNSVSKRGIFHVELRFAMEIASRMPLDEIFVLPVRLDECALPRMLEAQIQSVDLFPDWERGLETLTTAMHQQMEARGKR